MHMLSMLDCEGSLLTLGQMLHVTRKRVVGGDEPTENFHRFRCFLSAPSDAECGRGSQLQKGENSLLYSFLQQMYSKQATWLLSQAIFSPDSTVNTAQWRAT